MLSEVAYGELSVNVEGRHVAFELILPRFQLLLPDSVDQSKGEPVSEKTLPVKQIHYLDGGGSVGDVYGFPLYVNGKEGIGQIEDGGKKQKGEGDEFFHGRLASLLSAS